MGPEGDIEGGAFWLTCFSVHRYVAASEALYKELKGETRT
jgi:hypothetical protein